MNDTKVDNAKVDDNNNENPGICENCIKGERLSGIPKGTLIATTPLPSYFASATGETNPDGQKSGNALILLPDIFGFNLPNPKLLADRFAELCGVDVWAVDVFNGKLDHSDHTVLL